MKREHRLDVGIGLRQPHYEAWLAQRPALGFVEVHSENFFGQGGAALAVLEAVRAEHAVGLHGVGLSLGSAGDLDAQHLDKLAALVDRVDPVRVSEHACFARVALPGQTAMHAADLLPVAFNKASLDLLVAHVEQVQTRLQRPLLIEHLSAYVAHDGDTMAEVDFLIALCRRSGCQLLLDLNNLMVNGLNRARRAAWRQGDGAQQAQAPQRALSQALAESQAFVQALPPGLVGQLHLAGCRWPLDPHALVIDDHSQRVSPACWTLFDTTLAHLGPLPTLIEWDTDLPDLSVLLDEADLAQQRWQAASPATRGLAP